MVQPTKEGLNVTDWVGKGIILVSEAPGIKSWKNL